MQRRDFVKVIGVWLLANDLLADTGGKHAERDPVIGSPYFGVLVYALFPVEDQLLSRIYEETIQRLRSMRRADWERLKGFYELFRARAECESKGDAASLTLPETEAIVARFITDPGTAGAANAALDVFYKTVAKSDSFGEALWQRRYSKVGEMCLYWYNYDSPVT